MPDLFEQFIHAIQKSKLYGEDITPTAENIADMLWLAVQKGAPQHHSSHPPSSFDIQHSEFSIHHFPPLPIPPSPSLPVTPSPSLPLSPSPHPPLPSPDTPSEAEAPTPSRLPFKTPAPRALRHSLDLARAFKPLKQTYPSRSETILDTQATVERIAEERLWLPVLKPTPTRWLDIALVVEDSPSCGIWQQTIKEFQQLLLRQGAFRDAKLWYVRPDEAGNLELFAANSTRTLSPKTLIDSEGRRAIFILSDCVSEAWYGGKWLELLQTWGNKHPVTILQLLPGKFWQRTALQQAESVWMNSHQPAAPNPRWQLESQAFWEEEAETTAGFPVPVVSLVPHGLKVWAQNLAGLGETQIAGYCFSATTPRPPQSAQIAAAPSFETFLATTSPTARRLAALMAAVPVQLPIARLIQQTMLPESDATHLAEVFLSGILRRIDEEKDPERRLYEFADGMREKMLATLPKSETVGVIDRLSAYIAQRAGLSMQEFMAELRAPSGRLEGEMEEEVFAFARVTLDVLKHLGGEYAAFADELERDETPEGAVEEAVSEELAHELERYVVSAQQVEGERLEVEPVLEELPSGRAELTIEETVFVFTVATLERQFSIERENAEWVIQRQQGEARGIIQRLNDEVQLELMEIPGGTFLMGSPEEERDRYDDEGPQHEVTVPPFYMGRYPVTQGQWRVVAGWEKVERDLDPDPFSFKEPYEEYERWTRPVEMVSWYDAVEFCARLSRKTGWEYRLPSEAEWEYACRAVRFLEEGQKYPPFHFGETISTELANYDGNYTYGEGEKGEYREQTTPVGYFQAANAFGLYDMHGNVWEWCADAWHSNYEGAPDDGAIWLSSDSSLYVLRGGSWNLNPGYCRSACRYSYNPDDPDYRFSNIGFRVVGCAARTL
ncbi:SAV_2336 N-terminal domain-related protein [Oscillatoria sp. FACHB-1406]|uniref:SAV_2336 N-terminal domain-related protein n=1 Tax=Oscillatoria sp. FACHB-1406 TaxID=2692846 RepID=UPI0016867042|nr:formylglycine-generating enzyme family protein [Oscillatoria sp. FACHB-1406]